MFRPRVIPLLLLKNQGLVKSVKFKDFKYIGDPINAVKIFNDLEADELVFLDIVASREQRSISAQFVRKVGEEANMPFSVGGGIRDIETIRGLLKSGAEKVIINTYAFENPEFIRCASDEFGSSTITVSIDVKKNIFKKKSVYISTNNRITNVDPVQFAELMEHSGAGEIIINSVDRDGTMEGYDIDLVKAVSNNVSIPVIAAGGAGSIDDFKIAINHGNASAVAAGSFFVFHGKRKAVLISYPNHEDLLSIKKE